MPVFIEQPMLDNTDSGLLEISNMNDKGLRTYSRSIQWSYLEPDLSTDEHLIRCSYCGRNLIIKDTVNDGIAFLSHLKNDHNIYYVFQRMTAAKTGTVSNARTVLDDTDFSK